MDSRTDLIDKRVPSIPREACALIKALQLCSPNTADLRDLSDQEWTNLLAFCDLAHLTLPLARVPNDGFPGWVVCRLEKNAADNASRFERVKETYTEAALALDRADVDHMVIKGFTQAPEYVDDPCWRAQSDLDLYCPAEMIERARTALEAIGYKSEEHFDYRRADHLPTLIRTGRWQPTGNHFDPEMPLSIELHLCLWNKDVNLFSILGVDEFWSRRSTRLLDGMSFPCLHPVDHLGYLSLHILRNIIGGEWPLHLVRELAAFLHSHAGDDVFWKSWSEQHNSSLRSLQAVAFYYAQAWFSCEVHPQVEREVTNLLPLRQQWLRRFVWSPVEGMFHANRDSIWLHVTFLESAKARRTVLKRLFVPLHISSINSPGARIQNRRALGKDGEHRYLRYLRFVISRCAYYSYLSVSSIVRVVRWRMETLISPRLGS